LYCQWRKCTNVQVLITVFFVLVIKIYWLITYIVNPTPVPYRYESFHFILKISIFLYKLKLVVVIYIFSFSFQITSYKSYINVLVCSYWQTVHLYKADGCKINWASCFQRHNYTCFMNLDKTYLHDNQMYRALQWV
jgi:hypothetical protein